MIFLPWEGGEQWDGTRFHPRTSPPHRPRRQPQGRSRTRTSQTPQNKTHHFLLPIHMCGLCKNSFDHKGCHKCRLFMLKTQPTVTYFNQKKRIYYYHLYRGKYALPAKAKYSHARQVNIHRYSKIIKYVCFFG